MPDTTPHRVVDKDELTTGVSLYDNVNDEHGRREGFSVKIIKGDDSGVDHRRYNKFVEQDSRDFTEKYFRSKKCAIGSSVVGISMFGSNELLGDSRTSQIGGIYNFAGKTVDNIKNDDGVNLNRYTYFEECVYNPITRNDFRAFKKEVYANLNKDIIHIPNCFKRFNLVALFAKPQSQIESSGITGAELIAGSDAAAKISNIQSLNAGNNADNASETTYSNLMKTTNQKSDSLRTMKQREIDIYGKAYGYRQRINQILSNLREQTKNDAANFYNVQLTGDVTNELRRILSFLAIIERTNAVILFENNNKLFDKTKNAVTDGKNALIPFSPTNAIDTISGDNNIFHIPNLDDEIINTKDEKRYVYGITFYFDNALSMKLYK
jgi:hypothetical protein